MDMSMTCLSLLWPTRGSLALCGVVVMIIGVITGTTTDRHKGVRAGKESHLAIDVGQGEMMQLYMMIIMFNNGRCGGMVGW